MEMFGDGILSAIFAKFADFLSANLSILPNIAIESGSIKSVDCIFTVFVTTSSTLAVGDFTTFVLVLANNGLVSFLAALTVGLLKNWSRLEAVFG